MVVIWEVTLLTRAVRVNLHRPVREFFGDLFSSPSYQVHPMDPGQVFEAGELRRLRAHAVAYINERRQSGRRDVGGGGLAPIALNPMPRGRVAAVSGAILILYVLWQSFAAGPGSQSRFMAGLFIWGIGTLSIVLLGGVAGQISLCQMSFAAVGVVGCEAVMGWYSQGTQVVDFVEGRKGTIDFKAMFQRIEQAGYRGHYMQAFGSLDDMLAGRETLAALATKAVEK